MLPSHQHFPPPFWRVVIIFQLLTDFSRVQLRVSDGHEARLTSIEQTLQLLLEENRQRNRQQAASGVVEFSSIDSQCGTYATSQAQEGDAAAASHHVNYVANIPEDDTVDGMGAIKFADEQESGFFG